VGIGSIIAVERTGLSRIAWKFTLPRTRAALRQRRRRGLIIWWPVTVAALLVCGGLRGFADDIGFPVHGSETEHSLFGFPTLWLQGHIYTLWPWFFGWASALIHVSWFPVPWAAALFISWRRPERIGSFFRWWIVLNVGVLIPFALFPLEPPWMAEPGVSRVVVETLHSRMDDPNALAAMPSLHVALPLTIAAWFYKDRWTLPALVMLSYGGLVAFEVVLSGEHYVIDVIGAAAAAGFIYVITSLNFRRLLSAVRVLVLRQSVSGKRGPPGPAGLSEPAFSSVPASNVIPEAAVSRAGASRGGS